MANENLSERKSLGIVDWFGDRSSGKIIEYGFITLLVSRQDSISKGDVHLAISNVLRNSRKPKKNDFIVFDIQETFLGKDALNAIILNKREVAGQLDLSDTRELVQVIGALNILKNIEPNFKEKVLDAFNKHFYKFTDDEICDCVDKLYNSPQEIVKVLAEKFDTAKVTELIINCAEKNPRKWADFIFSSDENFPTELIVKLFPYATAENRFTAFKKYCGQFTDDEICDCVDKLYNSPQEIVKVLAEKFDTAKVTELIIKFAEKYPRDWANVVLTCEENFPTELIVKLFPYAKVENRFTAFKKYCGQFTDDEICDCVYKLNNSPQEIVKVLAEKLDADKIQNIVMTCTEKDLKSYSYSVAIRYKWIDYVFGAEETFPTEFILKFWNYADTEKKFTAFAKYCDQFTEEEICDCVDNKLNNSPQEIVKVLAEKFEGSKVKELIKNCAEKNPRKWADFIFSSDKNFPTELIVKLFPYATDENKLAAFKKYCGQFTDDEICDCVDNKLNNSPQEIVKVLAEKFEGSKVKELIKNYAEKNPRKWADFIFSSDKNFPTELIVKLFPYAKVENRFTAFKKYFDKFTDDEIFTCTEGILKNTSRRSLKEVTNLIKINRPNDWQDIFSMCIDKSTFKQAWIDLLLDDFENFKQVKLSATTRILMMYAAAKEDKISQTLVDEFEKKLKRPPSPVTIMTQLVYAYFRAGYEKNSGNETASRKYLRKADDLFLKLFNVIVRNIKREDLFPLPSNYGVNIFPPCQKPKEASKKVAGDKIIECFFCEATPWYIENPETGEYYEDAYCPRLGGKASSCKAHPLLPNKPDLNLPSENWSLLELVAKFDLTIYTEGELKALEKLGWKFNLSKLSVEKINREYFARLGGEFNRLYELRERLKCRICGKYMHSIKNYADWKYIQSASDMLNDIFRFSEHFAIFNATTFECRECDETVYLNYCWHCKEIIDSRDSKVTMSTEGYPKEDLLDSNATRRLKYGYYLCMNCGAGYCDAKDTYGHPKYAVEPGTICPKCTKCTACGGKNFEIIKVMEEGETKAKLRCKQCGNEMYAPLTMKKISEKKYKCSSCGHIVMVDSKKLEDYKKSFNIHSMPWAVANENLENKNFIEEPEPEFWSSEEYIYNESRRNSANKNTTQIPTDDQEVPF